MIDAMRVGHLDQVAPVTGRPAVDVHVLAGIDVRLYSDRGLDVGAAWFRGLPLAWISPIGEGGAEATAWGESWGGGLVTTCGLENVGAPSKGAGHALEGPLYHVNLGRPLWDAGARLESDAAEVVPRDAAAAPHDWRGAPPEPVEEPERVWERVGATHARVTNEGLGVSVTITSDLPRQWQWVHPAPGMCALGVEPANCSVLGRAHDRAEGRLPTLEPGEERTTSVTIRAETL